MAVEMCEREMEERRAREREWGREKWSERKKIGENEKRARSGWSCMGKWERQKNDKKWEKNKIKGEKEREKSVSGLRVEENVGKKMGVKLGSVRTYINSITENLRLKLNKYRKLETK